MWDYVFPANDEIAGAIINALPDYVWVERDYWALDEGQQLIYGWKDFCDLVKHKNRYMFHLRPRRPAKVKPAVPQDSSSSQDPQEPAQPPGSATGGISGSTEALASESAAQPDLNDLHLTPESFAEIMGTNLDDMIDERQEGVSASRMLEAIGDVVDEVGLVKEISAHTRLFRGRIGPSGNLYRTARKRGPPPERKAVANE